MAVDGVLDVIVRIREDEVEVIARRGKVDGEQLVAVVNQTADSSHSFKAKLKRGPEPVE